jgi:Signal peptidase (SPase) II
LRLGLCRARIEAFSFLVAEGRCELQDHLRSLRIPAALLVGSTLLISGAHVAVGAVVVHEFSDALRLHVIGSRRELCMFMAAAAAIGIPVIVRNSRCVRLSASLIAGAALANATSQLIWGGVPDYLRLGHMFFNIADATLVIAIFLLIAGASRWAWITP